MLSLKTKITTPRLAETRGFYARVFGLKLVEEWDEPDDKGVILSFEDGPGQALLEIYHGKASHDFSGLSLQFKVASLAKFIETLPEDVSREGPKKRPWGSTYLYLRDPNDIMIIVYEGGY